MVRFNPSGTKLQKGQIGVHTDYHLPLLEHWSLYDSMQHSHYLMIKLQLWEDKGLKRLN